MKLIVFIGSAHDATVTVIGNGHVDPSSIPGWGCLHFTQH